MKPCAFLLACVLAAVAYGVASDQLTVTISPEYVFHYGQQDGLRWQAPGPFDPAVRWTAAEMGARATWWVGFGCGLLLLLVNRWRRETSPALPYRALLLWVGLAMGSAAAAEALGGALGALAGSVTPLAPMAPASVLQPRRFVIVGGMHLGAYVGAFIGGCSAIAWVLRRRVKLGAGRRAS